VTIARRILLVLGGLAVGLLLTEYGFKLRDRGAFPHLNLYRPDPVMAVRLVPGTQERISFSGNPVSEVRINASGYRGADWPASAKDELFIVGDSQAFGLGVNEEDSYAQRLGAALHRPVANGAVPTYGPAEYNAVLAEELPKRRPKTVIYTINLANDLFEAAHPNTERHAVWDGWAVRKETAPSQVTSFPGRALLFRDSHAFFAARGLWWKRFGDTEAGKLASEGSWQDLLSLAKRSAEEQSTIRSTIEADRARREAELAQRRVEMSKLDAELGELMQRALPEEEVGPSTLRTAKANPGDIVRVFYGEGSRPVPAIAEQIRLAAEARRRFEQQLKEKGDQKGLAALKRRDTLDDDTQRLRVTPAEVLRSRSPLWPHLERARALCEAAGAELVVLVLPLDVQVSALEWKKYGVTSPPDLAGSRVLADDVLDISDELGLRAVDAWPALAAAEPGAFLDGDLHMTPKGHQAVAQAIAQALSSPPRPKRVALVLPLGRAPVPPPVAWAAAVRIPREYGEVESDLKRIGCTGDVLKEWIRIRCKGARPDGLVEGREPPLLFRSPEGLSLIGSLVEGNHFALNMWKDKTSGYVAMEWALGEAHPEVRAGGWYLNSGKVPSADKLAPSADEATLCACHQKLSSSADCSTLYGSADADCMRTYAGDCENLLRCARGDLNAPPACQGGKPPAGVIPRCVVATPAVQAKKSKR